MEAIKKTCKERWGIYKCEQNNVGDYEEKGAVITRQTIKQGLFLSIRLSVCLYLCMNLWLYVCAVGQLTDLIRE